MRAIVIGLPSHPIKQIRHAVENGKSSYRERWSVEFLPARKNLPEILDTDVATILGRAALHDHSHIFGMSKQDGAIRQRIKNQIKEFFRFRWLDPVWLSYIGDPSGRFFFEFGRVLEEEEFWQANIKPADIRSPLVLPRMSFGCRHPHNLIWEQSESYGDMGTLQAVPAALNAFRTQHWIQKNGAGRAWTDGSDLVFDHQGSRHASAPFPRNWKYSFKIEDKFHYDVTHREKRAFSLCDRDGTFHHVKANGYINVDPHGQVRVPA